MKFKPLDKVKCVQGSEDTNHCPVLGKTYTVLRAYEVIVHVNCCDEHSRFRATLDDVMGWNVDRFEKVNEDNTLNCDGGGQDHLQSERDV